MSNTHKDQATKKIEIAIDKMIDLSQDFDLPPYAYNRIGEILDKLNSLSSMLYEADRNNIKRR